MGDGVFAGGCRRRLCGAERFLFALAPLLLVLFMQKPGAAVEPWSDPDLPVTEGLALWLDASRAGEGEDVSADGSVAAWRDASGNGRDARQEKSAARPQRILLGSHAIIRMDGMDDHLRAAAPGATLDAFTLFLVAAPRQNVGNWRGLLAFHAPGELDYTSGLNLDLGLAPSPTFSTLNLEGRGFQGARNLRAKESPFGSLHTFLVSSQGGESPVEVTIDGEVEGQRPRGTEAISFEEITLGARHVSAYDGKIQPNGFGRVDIAELLLFDRALSDEEREAVANYLKAKVASLPPLPPIDDGTTEQLFTVDDPPPVQVFPPGFSVRELPLDLPNINNVKYRADGKLVALAYDGRVWLLDDTDGDGLEDRARVFWDNPINLRATIGMDLTPPGYAQGDGLFVVGKTQCLLIVDTDGDDRADREIEIAGGWKEGFTPVDGLGVAFDPRDGSIYFGRSTYNFMAPLLPDENGVPQYTTNSEAGAILRIAPDFKTHEVFASGIRVPVGLRINRHGDLFATDQEGATWVPNGNPFDELLHIQRGRHYGFPARHPEHLPDVIDEPSTFDYSPQHQSNCGLNFNESVVEGGPIFGPESWRDDVFVAGYSRGKLYRTRLLRTAHGYMAKNHILACLNMLTVDACVSPAGDLVVACHSGGPDWGSGPTGKGKLYKISYSDPERPQIALVYPSSPRELHVEFDRPIDPAHVHDLLSQARLSGGEHVRAGDRFETLSPGYAIVHAQKAAPRYALRLHSAQLTPDRRTLVLASDPLTRSSHFALQLPPVGRPETTPQGELPQHAAIDVDFDLSGCRATWTPADGSVGWQGWLPHLDLDVARRLTAGSARHDALWRAMERPGELRLEAQLDLSSMLRPAVQPGSKIDYEYPPEIVTVTFESSAEGELSLEAPTSKVDRLAPRRTAVTTQPDIAEPVPIRLRLTVHRGLPSLSVSWSTNEDPSARPLQIARTLVPWREASRDAGEVPPAASAPELAGGSWARGYREFFGQQAACFKCHAIHGRGGDIGPNLSNLQHRDYASVLRDITQPSYAINPDHLSYTAILDDGRALTGVVRAAGDRTMIGDIDGNKIEVATDEIDELVPSSVSTMPEGIVKALGDARMRDLMTFLLTPPPQMPRDYAGPRPKPRPLAAVAAALEGAPQPPEATLPINLVLVAGPKDHGAGEHDYPAWQKAWTELLGAANDVEVSTAWEWPSKEQFDSADVIIFYQRGDWNERRAADIDPYLERGGGLVYIHWAVDGREQGPEFAERIGLASRGASGFRHGEIILDFNPEVDHPITRNFSQLTMIDETYWKLAGKVPPRGLLATAVEEGAPHPQLWVTEPRGGRVFVSIPGHYSWTFDDPLFRVLLLRGIAWAAGEPVDRFNDLVWPGAEIAQ